MTTVVMVIGPRGVQFGLKSYTVHCTVITKCDNCEAGVGFVNKEYDYRPNWTTLSPAAN